MNVPSSWKWLAPCLVAAAVLAGCATTPTTQVDFAADDIPESATAEQRELRALKRVRQAQAAVIDGNAKKAVALFKAALEIYLQLDDFSAQAAIYNDLALMLNSAGKSERAAELLDKAQKLAARGSEPAIEVEALYNMGVVQYAMGHDALAESRYSTAFDAAVKTDNTEMQGLALNGRGNVRRKLGRLDEAVADYRAAIKRWATLGRHPEAAVGNMNVGYCLVLMAQPDKAAVAFQNAIDAFDHQQTADSAILIPHLEEMIRRVKTDPATARAKVLKLLGKAAD